MKINCKHCGKTFVRQPWQVKKNKDQFCSIACHAEWRKKKIITKCNQCGKEIKKHLSQLKRTKLHFCDTICHGKWKARHLTGKKHLSYRRIETTCSYCFKKFMQYPCQIKRNRHLFCSQECYGKWRSENLIGEDSTNWQGGISCEPYCDVWADKAFKEDIKIRDNYKCQNPNCWGTSDRLGIHHIDYIKKNCHPNNLITLCNSCNSRANTEREWHTAYYQAFMHRNNKIINHLTL